MQRATLTYARKLAVFIFATLVLAACGDDATAPPDPSELTFAPELGIDFSKMTRTASGLYYEDVTVGTGATATAGDDVATLYSGWLPNGTLFDSSTDPNDPLNFRLGVGQVIRGWDEGLIGMRVGGVRTLVIRPGLAYGNQQVGPIPPNSTLVFRVQLLNVQ